MREKVIKVLYCIQYQPQNLSPYSPKVKMFPKTEYSNRISGADIEYNTTP